MADLDLLWNEEYFWNLKMTKRGKAVPSEPEYAYVPVAEQYDYNALKNILREWYGRYACPACGKPYFFAQSAWDCHPKASAYHVWERFGHHRGPMGYASVGEAIMANISSGFSGPSGPSGF